MVMEFLNREPLLLGLAIGAIAVVAIIFHYKSREALLRECVEREKAALEKGAMQQQQIIEGMNQNKKTGRDNPNRIYDLQCRFVSDCDVDIRSRQTVGWYAYKDVYKHVESFLIGWSGNNYYLWAEVGLGGFLEAASSEEEKRKRAFNSFNSKRADFLIANWKREPVAVIEYNGSGHGTDEETLKRDKVKQLTLEKAGVPLIVIRPDESEEALLEKVSQVLSKEDQRLGEE